MEYPSEDICKECGEHLGWIMVPLGELFRLGICEDCEDEQLEDE